jgi:hypothetical protein
MPDTPLPIANGFYTSGSLPLSAQECTGWYPALMEAPALNQEVLFGVPGKTLLVDGEGLREVNRGALVMAGIGYFVNGSVLYRLNQVVTVDSEVFSVTQLGVIDGVGRVSMATNGTQLCVLIPGGTGYIYTADPDTLTEITDLDFRANGDPQHVRYADGYFVFTTDSKKWIISELNDGLAYNALDFGSAESDPDDTVAPAVFNNQVFICGSITTEAFQNIGGAGFPFQRTGLFIPKGVVAPFSVTDTSGEFMFIGAGEDEAPAVWAVRGNKPVKVSTDAVDTLLQSFTEAELAEAFAWSYAQRGAFFVGFALPTTTIVYDLTSQRWHERKSQVISDRGIKEVVRSRINSTIAINRRIFIGDSQDGRVGELDPDVYLEYGNPIIRPVSTQPFQNNMNSFRVPSIELTVESGVGNDDAPDPKISLEISRDGGKTWSFKRWRKMGKIGEYQKRLIWRRNGRMSRMTMFRFTLSDPVKPVIMQLTANVK